MVNRPEQELQKACVNYLRGLERLTGRLTFFHVPNGGYRRGREAAIFKTLGVRAGVSDLVILLDGGQTVFAELKAKGGKLTNNQTGFLKQARGLGFAAETIEAEYPAEAVKALAHMLRLAGFKEAQ